MHCNLFWVSKPVKGSYYYTLLFQNYFRAGIYNVLKRLLIENPPLV